MLKLITLFSFGISFTINAATPVSIISLNMHGYHPMGEETRYLQYKNEKITASPSHIHYFSPTEIKRGHKLRLSKLSKDFLSLTPDIIMLQEVGAGSPASVTKNCEDFYRSYNYDYSWENSALRLAKMMSKKNIKYTPLLACRGNLGWFSGENDLKNKRIVTIDSEKKVKKIIFDYNDNPYPNGILVEGMAILISSKFTLLENIEHNLSYNSKNDQMFIQVAILKRSSKNRWYMAINLHAGHKVAHFEQAIALRKYITGYIEHNRFNLSFGGIIIGGDFNARLFRPNSKELSEVGTIPFEIEKTGEYSFKQNTNSDHLKQTLIDQLTKLNNSTKYKSWATIRPKEEAKERIENAVNSFFSWQEKIISSRMDKDLILKESFSNNNCIPRPSIQGTCHHKNRIDHFFYSNYLKHINSYVFYNKNSWVNLRGPSDHPALFLSLEDSI